MATSHFCNGEWRDGPLAGCPRHKQLSKRQATVHKGVGTPGGFKTSPPKSGSGGSSSGGSSSSSSGGD